MAMSASDTNPDAAGEKLQFSGGVSIIEIGQSHLPADTKPAAAVDAVAHVTAAADAASPPASAAASADAKAKSADADAAADKPADTKAADKPITTADKATDAPATATATVSASASASATASASAGTESGSAKASDKPAAEPASASAAADTPAVKADASPSPAATPSASAAPVEPKSASHAKQNGALEPLTPGSPSTPATPATANATAGDAKADAKADAKKADDKPKDKKKDKKEAKPTRDINPALAARVKAANQYNRKWKAAKDAGLNDDDIAAAAGAGERRPTRITATPDAKAQAAAAGAPVVVVESEVERMRRERREKKDRLNLAEKVNAFHVDQIDPDLEAKVAAVEYADDTTPAPDVASLLKDNEKCGVLEERTSALIGYHWTPYTAVIQNGHFYWIKDEKKDTHAVGRVKFVKTKVRVEINDSVLELYDPDVPKKALQTRYFRVPESSGDFVDSWLLAIKRAKLKFYKTKAAAILKEEEKQRKELGASGPSAAVLSPAAAKAAALAAKRKAAQQMLTRGIQLMKHQAGTRYARAVWCTPQMDRVCWGDPKMDTVKGFVLLDDIIEVADHIALPMKAGAFGIAIAHNLHAFSGTDEAVLQFECDDSHARDAWVQALRAFTDKPN